MEKFSKLIAINKHRKVCDGHYKLIVKFGKLQNVTDLLFIQDLLLTTIPNYSNSKIGINTSKLPRDINLTVKELQLAKCRLKSSKSPVVNGLRSGLHKLSSFSFDELLLRFFKN